MESKPAYPTIIPPDYTDEALRFAGPISRMLPMLGYLITDIASGSVRLPERAVRDYEALYGAYRRFLSRHRMYEPAFLDAVDGGAPGAPSDSGALRARRSGDGEPRVGSRVVLVFPELVDDFPRYAPALPDAERITVPEEPEYRYRRHATSLSEVDAVIEAVFELLRGGTHPEDIVISVAGIDSTGDMIEEAGRIRSVPLDLRYGRALAEHPEGRLFSRLRECISSGFDLAGTKAVLLDPRVPWKNRRLHAGLIRFGIDQRIGRNGDSDIWLERLGRAGVPRLSGYYRALRDVVRSMTESRSFADLRTAVLRFVNGYLDVSETSAPSRRVLEAAIDTLAGFEAVEATLGSELPGVRPFSLWTEYLSEQVYVTPGRTDAVWVYPYRVTAGVCPAHHFVVNGADPTVRIVHRPYPFLPATALGPEADSTLDTDVTDRFLKAYAVSGGEVMFSSADTGPKGRMIAPSEFIRSGADGGADNAATVEPKGTAIDEASFLDPYRREVAYWRGSDPSPSPLFPVQREGLLRAAGWSDQDDVEVCRGNAQAAMSPETPDLTRAPVADPALAAELARRCRDENGRLRVAPTSLDLWAGCPFGFLVSHVLGVDDEDYAVRVIDPRIEGRLLHQAAEMLIERLEGLEASTSGDDRAEERTSADNPAAEAEDLIEEVLDRVMRPPECYPQPYPLLLDERIAVFREAFRGLLEWERRLRTGPPVALEGSYETTVDEVVLHGRLDRISRTTDGLFIVDYKRSRAPTKRELIPFEGASTYQIPCYVYLAEAAEGPVSRAVYYSLFKAKETTVFVTDDKRSWLTREELDAFVEVMLRRLREMAGAIVAGDYGVDEPGNGCDTCSIRAICRRRYVVRRGAR